MDKSFLGLITRCKDEFFISEFCEYYLEQGVDKIYIIDDDSKDKSIYESLLSNKSVVILYKKNLFAGNQMKEADALYKEIRNEFEWIISVDVDEFITTKKNTNNTIRQELETTFKDCDCVKVPWVMMACNNLEHNPTSVLKTIVHRWNHDKKHMHKISKFRCRYNKIEVKCIFKTETFGGLSIHHPSLPSKRVEHVRIVESVFGNTQQLNPFYSNLRESHIANGHLLCYHYRIISRENCLNKLSKAQYRRYSVEDLMASDHPDLVDNTIKEKFQKKLSSILIWKPK